jgi:hypothetical protein
MNLAEEWSKAHVRERSKKVEAADRGLELQFDVRSDKPDCGSLVLVENGTLFPKLGSEFAPQLSKIMINKAINSCSKGNRDQ